MHAAPPTLENCDREPIHIPGAIQPHGALLAFGRDGRLTHASTNAAELLGFAATPGQPLPAGAFEGDPALHAMLSQAIADAAAGGDEVAVQSTELSIGERSFDVVMHGWQGRTVCEFELAPGDDVRRIARSAHQAYRVMDTLKRQKSLDRLLASVVVALRDLTGFDRVMAYRFRHDDSGDVVAEARDPGLQPYLGMRYPASDIPAQARRLYTLNTLRLIADVDDAPVALLAAPGTTEPLDLSYSVLRSVSPIHIEYLRNMGVRASMSVSIVVGGRLWGMLACHHHAPLRTPYPVRVAVDAMAQVLASTVQSIEAGTRETAVAQAAWLRGEIVQGIANGIEIGEIVATHEAALRASLRGDALAVLLDGAAVWTNGVDPDWAAALPAWLGTQPEPLVHVHDAAQLPPHPEGAAQELRCCGLLALRFDAPHQGYIVALRREQIQTIRWGGKPDKVVALGPLGPRLTPRGSFAEWRETVRDRAEPWSAVELEIAAQLQHGISRAHTDRLREVEELRSQLWAMLGHDLRSPLQSLSMASYVLDRGQPHERLNAVIRNSTHRMKQLVSNVLDLSRLQQGMAMTLSCEAVDVVPLVDQLLEETRIAHPTVAVAIELPASLRAEIDAVRFSQAVANLLSNSRHHGQGQARLRLAEEGDSLVLEVSNASPPIAPEVAASLFQPFKRLSGGNLRNRTGLGLGLYIAHQVVEAHGGRLDYRAADGRVAFTLRLPLRRAPA